MLISILVRGMLVGDFQLKIRTSTSSSDFLTIPNRHRNTFTEFVGIPARSSSNPAHHHWCNIHIDALDTTKTPSTTTTACHDRRSRLGSSRNQTLNRTARIAEQVPTLHLRHSTTGASRIQQGSSHKNRKGPHPHTQSIIVSLSQHSAHTPTDLQHSTNPPAQSAWTTSSPPTLRPTNPATPSANCPATTSSTPNASTLFCATTPASAPCAKPPACRKATAPKTSQTPWSAANASCGGTASAAAAAASSTKTNPPQKTSTI
jgi:hypothetical protein